MSACPVVRIKPSHPSQGDFVEINESDFDPAVHEMADLPPPPVAAPIEPVAEVPEVVEALPEPIVVA